MSYSPIAFTGPNYRDYSNNWIKAYEQGTTTPKAMALDSAGAVTVAKLEVNADGFIETAGGALVIPYIDGSYDLWMFPTEAEADANDTTNAIQLADDITGVNGAILANTTVLKYDTLNDAVIETDPNLIYDGAALNIKERTSGNGGGAMWDVVLSSTVTENTYDIVQCTGIGTLSLVLRLSDSMSVDQFGAMGDGNEAGTTGTDDTAAIQRAIVQCRHVTMDGSKIYRMDGEIYLGNRHTLDAQQARIVYTGTGTGIGQTTSWAGGTATGPVAGITLGEEVSGALQSEIRFINFKLYIKDIAGTGICMYGTWHCEVRGTIQGYYQPFDNTRSNVGVRFRGTTNASNWGNFVNVNCNHINKSFRIENYGVANTQPTSQMFFNCEVQGDYSTDDSSIGFDFSDSTVSSQGEGTKIIGGNVESTKTGIYVGALNDGINIDTRFEISSSNVGSRCVKMHATSANVDIQGSQLDAALIGAVDGGYEGFSSGGANRMLGSNGSIRTGGSESSFAGKTPPIHATNIETHLYKENGTTNFHTNDVASGTGQMTFQCGNIGATYGGAMRLFGGTHATNPGECHLTGATNKGVQFPNGLGSAVITGEFRHTAIPTTTALWILDTDNNTLEQVRVGAANSGGSGYKVLRILN